MKLTPDTTRLLSAALLACALGAAIGVVGLRLFVDTPAPDARDREIVGGTVFAALHPKRGAMPVVLQWVGVSTGFAAGFLG